MYQKKSNRKLIVIFLLLAVVILASLLVVVGIYIQQQQQPPDTGAAGEVCNFPIVLGGNTYCVIQTPDFRADSQASATCTAAGYTRVAFPSSVSTPTSEVQAFLQQIQTYRTVGNSNGQLLPATLIFTNDNCNNFRNTYSPNGNIIFDPGTVNDPEGTVLNCSNEGGQGTGWAVIDNDVAKYNDVPPGGLYNQFLCWKPTTVNRATCNFVLAGDAINDSSVYGYSDIIYQDLFYAHVLENRVAGMPTWPVAAIAGGGMNAQGYSAQSIFTDAEGIFYMSAAGGNLASTTDPQILREYLAAGGNVTMIVDDATASSTANTNFLDDYGLTVTGQSATRFDYTVAQSGVNPAYTHPSLNTYPNNERGFASSPGNITSTGASPLVTASACQYNLGADCIWWEAKTVGGGTLNVTSSYGFYGGGALTHANAISSGGNAIYSEYVARVVGHTATNLMKQVYCAAQVSACGNGTVETGETCDDGNIVGGDGCSISCQITTQCNDGVDNDGDGDIDCQAGNEDAGCFPDGAGGGGTCNPAGGSETAGPAVCGNGALNTGEACDDGNLVAGDGCSATCTVTVQCNDGVDNDGDGDIDCQPGNEDAGCFPDGAGGGGACSPTDGTETNGAAVCGNGIVNTGETCDDGNTTAGDGCSATCQTTTACNDGVDNDGDGDIDCQVGNEDLGCFPDGAGGGGACTPGDGNETNGSICGNGAVNAGEACDDGNLVAGDGCSITCTVTTQCNDGVDNDGDGDIDCQPGNSDMGCFPDGAGGGGACSPTDGTETDGAAVCGNGALNTGEACDDGNTAAGDGCSATCTLTTQCNDGVDNDSDGDIDCQPGNEDPGCFPDGIGGGGACNSGDGTESNTPPQCSDGIDNDGDGRIDCVPGNEDPGCFPNGAGGGGACNSNDGAESNLPNTALGARESLMVVMLGILMMLGGVAIYRFGLAEKWFPNSGKFTLLDIDETTGARFSDFETGAEIRARSKAKRRG